MKKLMTLLAATLAVTALMAQTNVTSENMVGYTTLNVTDGNYNMLSVPWDAVSGGALSISEIITDPLGAGAGLQGGGTLTQDSADLIQVWDPGTSGYAIYWLYDSGGAYADWDGQWIDGLGEISDVPFAKGASFWLLSKKAGPGDSSVTQAGQVPTVATVSQALTAGNYNMVANPYPVAYALNGAAAPDLLTAGAQGGGTLTQDSADLIQVWDPGSSGYAIYWLYDSGGAYADWDGQWIDGAGEIATAVLPVGQPFWYLSKGAVDFDFTFTKTY